MVYILHGWNEHNYTIAEHHAVFQDNVKFLRKCLAINVRSSLSSMWSLSSSSSSSSTDQCASKTMAAMNTVERTHLLGIRNATAKILWIGNFLFQIHHFYIYHLWFLYMSLYIFEFEFSVLEVVTIHEQKISLKLRAHSSFASKNEYYYMRDVYTACMLLYSRTTVHFIHAHTKTW